MLIPKAEDVSTLQQAQSLLQYLTHFNMAGIDTETTGLVRHRDSVVFWSLAVEDRRWCITRDLLPLFREYLEDPKNLFIFQNVNFDRAMFLNSGIDFHRHGRKNFRCYDTAVMHILLANNQPHDLKWMGKNILNVYMKSFKETFGKGSEEDTGTLLMEWYHKDPMRVVDYASLDAWVTYMLGIHFMGQLADTELGVRRESPIGHCMLDYYHTIEMPMHDVLWQMERVGAKIDIDYLFSKLPEINAGIEGSIKELSRLAGRVVNPNSPKQLLDVLYKYSNGVWTDRADNPVTSWTDGGQSGIKMPSTNADTLEERVSQLGCPISKTVLKFRELSKLKTTYIEGISERCDSNGRIHTSFCQHVTDTGRLSSKDPNLQ
jgi:DNA polymerase-1